MILRKSLLCYYWQVHKSILTLSEYITEECLSEEKELIMALILMSAEQCRVLREYCKKHYGIKLCDADPNS